ncbi:MAG: hypothetical protein J7M25_03855, partial [Deltaproteobacteria bacterium]|nr:hypothetical protein [Deltaproteobacteria bacterium]
MRRRIDAILGLAFLFALSSSACGGHSSNGGNGTGDAGNNANFNGGDGGGDGNVVDAAQSDKCPNGTDVDRDGYGEGCPAGPDCNDQNGAVHPGADEICNYVDDDCDGDTDEGVVTVCGNCSPYCSSFDLGSDPFPMPEDDSNVDANGVNLDPNGDIVLDRTQVNFNFLWIANRYDAESRGTISKVDTVNAVEVARYYTVTCFGNQAYQ